MRYLLFISENFLLAHATGRSGFSNGVVFKNNQRGRALFARYLDERTGSIFYGVLDSTEEEHFQEQLPRLRARDTRRAVNNIVDTRCEGAALWRHCIQSASAHSGDGPRLAITTVSDESDCSDWLSLLRKKNTLISELCLLSELCMEILPSNEAVVSILVLKIGHGDYRIIGFRDGYPVITRKLEESSVSMQVLVDEINKTVIFLNGSVVETDKQVSVIYLGDTTATQREELQRTGVVVRTASEVESQRSKKHIDRQSVIELLLQLMLSKRVRREHRLAGDYRSAFDCRRLNHSFIAGILCCVAVTAASGIAGARMIDSLDELSDAIDDRSAKLDERMTNIRSATYSDSEVEAMRRTIQIGNRVNQLMDYTPMRLLVPLATELSRFPVVQIMSVDWLVRNPLMDLNETDAAEYEALVSGFIQISDSEAGEAARSFNGFVTGLEESEQIHSVEVKLSPLDTGNIGSAFLSANSGTPMRFAINLGVRESLND